MAHLHAKGRWPVILTCIQLKRYLPSLSEDSLNTVFTCRTLICAFFKDLLESPIGSLL